MSTPESSGKNLRLRRAWLAFGVGISLVIGVVLGYSLSPENDTSEIEQRLVNLEQQLASMQNKTDMIEGAITGGGPIEQLACGIYLQLPGIPGDSEDVNHKDWILVLSYSYEGSKESEIAAPQYGEFLITKYVDKSSPKLAEAMNTGERFNETRLEIVYGNGAIMAYVLEGVTIKGVRVHQSLGVMSTGHMEDVSLYYEKIRWIYISPGTGDTAPETISSGWDIVENSPL